MSNIYIHNIIDVNLNKNILLGVNQYTRFIENNNLNIILHNIKINIDKYIEKNITKEKLIGYIIYKELIKRVFHPNRLLYISNTYNIDIEQLLNIY